MDSNDKAKTYHGAQQAFLTQTMRQRLVSLVDEIMGPAALLDDPVWAPMNGEMEALQRTALPGMIPGDGLAAQERLISKSLGLGS